MTQQQQCAEHDGDQNSKAVGGVVDPSGALHALPCTCSDDVGFDRLPLCHSEDFSQTDTIRNSIGEFAENVHFVGHETCIVLIYFLLLTCSNNLVTYQTPVKVERSGNIWVDGLTDGYRWGATSGNPAVGYTFIRNTDNYPDGTFGGYRSLGWSAEERKLITKGMRDIENVSGLRFVDRGDNNDDEVELWFYMLDAQGANDSFGFAYTPGSDSDEGLVVINRSMYQRPNGAQKHSIARGSFYGITFLHELCHAVGLKHPHDLGLLKQPRYPGLERSSNQYRDKGTFGQNAHPFTQLTYVDKGARNGYVPTSAEGFGFLKTLGALDVAALQWIYGVNMNYASRNNVYRLPLKNKQGTGWQAIWDTGGIDRIDAHKAKVSVSIDLRNATLDQSDHAGGYISSAKGIYGGFTIAHDWNGISLGKTADLCVIENATGGRSGDRLIGNGASNRLVGRAGADVLYGGQGGKDVLIGGAGKDQFWIDVNPESFAEVNDFKIGQDKLVFDVKKSLLSYVRGRDSIVVEYDNSPVAKLLGVDVPLFSLNENIVFNGFSGL